jgi:protein-L-isoaspartate(D-aspartate) O-methyltransferase
MQRLACSNGTGIHADGMEGAGGYAPFDRIIVSAAALEIPKALTGQLAPDGVMIVPVGRTAEVHSLVRVRKAANGSLTQEDLMAVRFVPLLPGLPGVS